MFSATDFLPACMTEFMNFVTTTFPNFGSGRISRLSALWRRDICLSLALCLHPAGLIPATVAWLLNAKTPLLAVFHTLRVEHAAEDVIAHARQILDAAAADHHHRMLLQVMALAGNVT